MPPGRVRPPAPARVRAAPPPPAPPAGRRRRAGGLQKSLPDLVAGVAAARPGEAVEVWFEDEARFGQEGTRTAAWADRGTRPTAPKQTADANLHVLTAVGPATGRAEGLVSERLNAGVVQAFLDQWAATIPAGTHAVLVWDGAGYHSACKAVRPPANVTPVTLPPYSPELNPVERLWMYLRQHHWSRPRPWPGGGPSASTRTICRCEYAGS